MHRSLKALQFYTSHSEEQISRLHERIRSSLSTTESLTETMIRLTGSPPIVSFKQDHVTTDDWTAFLAGTHHESLADFYGMLVARPILEETGTEEEEELPVLAYSRRADASKRRNHSETRSPASRLVIPWRWLALLMSCFLLGAGATYLYFHYIAPDTSLKTEATLETPDALEQKDTSGTEDAEESGVLYIKPRSSTIYKDRALTTPLYETDFGDGYLILQAKKDVTRIAVTEELAGYVSTKETIQRLKTDPVADEALLAWIKDTLNVSFTDDVTTLFGVKEAELLRLYGAPARTASDPVNTYLFYETHYFTVRQGQVVAIDWLSTDVSNDALRKLAPLQYESASSGLVTSNSYRIQRFETSTGRSQIRLAEQLF